MTVDDIKQIIGDLYLQKVEADSRAAQLQRQLEEATRPKSPDKKVKAK